MEGAERSRARRQGRLLAAWLLSALLVAAYFALPGGDDEDPSGTSAQIAEPEEEARLDIQDVSPSGALPGSAITIEFSGKANPDGEAVTAYVGKTELDVLARRPGVVVARLPGELSPGRVKIRVAADGRRSKPFDLRVKAQNLRGPFRKLVGGLALLTFGIGVLSRGIRELSGLESARALAAFARRRATAVLLGAALGAAAQSTTLAAGLLSGLVRSNLLVLASAAAALLGANLGAATAPLLTGIIDSREGLIVLAIGVLWLGLSADRRGSAIGRLLCGGGLLIFGLHTLRPGLESLVQSPDVLTVLAGLKATTWAHVALCALLGAVLVAIFQGPAPVLLLVVVVAQTTSHWDLLTALSVLSGTGLGASIGALLTLSPGSRSRQLAVLHGIVGSLSTVFVASTVWLWGWLADRIVPSLPHELDWGSKVLLPNVGVHLGVGFALSQMAAAIVLVPLLPAVAAWVERRSASTEPEHLPAVGDPVTVVQSRLARITRSYEAALGSFLRLVVDGHLESGREAEHQLADIRAELEEVLRGPVSVLPTAGEGDVLRRASASCLRLQSSIEALLRHGESLLEERISGATDRAAILPLDTLAEKTLREEHTLLAEGIGDVTRSLAKSSPVDLEASRSREIRINGLEARARNTLLGAATPTTSRVGLAVLEMAGAYEAAGNQIYRLVEVLAEVYPDATALSNFDVSAS